MSNPHNKITEEELIKELQRVAAEVDLPVTSHDMKGCGNYSATPYLSRWGSWVDALIEADVTVTEIQKKRSDSFTKVDGSDVVDELRRLYEKHGRVTKQLVDDKGSISSTTVQNKFDTFNTALKKAMVPVTVEQNVAKEFDCDGCGATVIRQPYEYENREYLFCSAECLHNSDVVPVTCSNCGEKTKTRVTHLNSENSFCDEECRVEYRSENPSNAVKISCDNCGEVIKRNKVQAQNTEFNYCNESCRADDQLNKNDLLEDFKSVSEELGRSPTFLEVNDKCKHGVDSYYKYFDGIIDVATEIGIEPNERKPVTVTCENCEDEFKRKHTHANNGRRNFCDRECYFDWMRDGNLRDADIPREPEYGPNWPKQRRRARERDGYECQHCGVSDQEHIDQHGVELHVHHIDPWHEFEKETDRNKLDNLVTLCAGCHATWEKIPVRPEVVA